MDLLHPYTCHPCNYRHHRGGSHQGQQQVNVSVALPLYSTNLFMGHAHHALYYHYLIYQSTGRLTTSHWAIRKHDYSHFYHIFRALTLIITFQMTLTNLRMCIYMPDSNHVNTEFYTKAHLV
jgi:hypothetical protein